MRLKAFIKIIVVLVVILNFSCESKKEHKVKIGFSQAMTTDQWRLEMNRSMQVQASLSGNVDLKILDAQDDIDKQIADISYLIESHVDVLIVSPIQSKPITKIVSKAMEAGIPTLIVDRKIEGDNYTAYLGADNIEVGRIAAQYILADLEKKEANIIEIAGLEGSSPAHERHLGFNQIVEKHNQLKIKGKVQANWEKESVKLPFKAILDSIPNIQYVFAHNDRMARGAWEVAKELGLENSIKIIGVDGLNDFDGGIKMVQDHILKATILYPTGGDEAIQLALKIYNKEQVAKINSLTTTVIDSRNAGIMKNQLDKIDSQQEKIENQLLAIKSQDLKYVSQSNLLKVAIGFLVVILSLAMYSLFSIFSIRKKNRQLQLTNEKITIQRNQIENIANQVKESNEAKLNFFTGLSHEFKTPITLILSSVESLGDGLKDKGSKIRSELELIYNNSNRLLRLVNNLLDFRKVEDQKFNIRVSKTNIFIFSKNIFNDFKREAIKRNIQFTIESNHEDLDLYIDRNLMDKVYFNLLSNAFKFTPDNGKIQIKIVDDIAGNMVAIHFKDNGIGILENEIENVFTPFFKGSNNRKNSSGVGLHLSKQFVELHLGKIKAQSYQGTEFIIYLYKGNTHFNEDQLISEQELLDQSDNSFQLELTDLNNDSAEYILSDGDSDRLTVLIIEDNHDLSMFLKNKLKNDYDILISDGVDGTEKAYEHIPDIILCDVNLPFKSGFEICKELKADLRTSHIPIIILTALSNKESYLEGLQSGADLYLTKPFSYSILMQSIKSLLYNREKLRYYYKNNIDNISDTQFGLTEQSFITKLNKVIEDNLNNSNFTVEDLASTLEISRVQLYRKVKAILDISVSDHITNFRLERSKEMLKSSKLNISEIAYSVGFSSPNYFSTSFKNKYGLTPKAFRST